ncbi:MAG: hypothetical protein Q8O72_11955 [Bacteroidales bacterium]|nr:hypothetical protein [Bacteroidales bacterium]
MIDWIKSNFGIKNLLILISVVIVIAGFLAGPSLYKLIKGQQYQGTTEAVVTNIIDKKGSFQHYNGTNEKTTGYDVSFVFIIKGKDYKKIETMNSSYDTKRLFDDFTDGKSCFLEIKYSLENPLESIITKPIFK